MNTFGLSRYGISTFWLGPWQKTAAKLKKIYLSVESKIIYLGKKI